MRIIKSFQTYVLGSFAYDWALPDRPRIFYHQTKSYLDRFLLKRQPTNKLLSIRTATATAGPSAGRPTGNESLSGSIYFRDNWFDPRSVGDVFNNDYTELDKDIFKGISSFVDVGANLGFVSACVRRHSPDCALLCFEALEENARICRMNNPSAIVETLAVGSKKGKAKLLVDQSGFMASSLKFGYAQTEREVPVVTLDDYFGEKDPVPGAGFDLVHGIDLVKIDVEGMEVEVIRGAKETLRRTKRVIVEIHSDELLGEFSSLMRSYGFVEKNRATVEKNVYISNWVSCQTRN